MQLLKCIKETGHQTIAFSCEGLEGFSITWSHIANDMIRDYIMPDTSYKRFRINSL